jgi:hypothetical protein
MGLFHAEKAIASPIISTTMIGILIIAHAPLATALRECALHVFPDCADGVLALDVLPRKSLEHMLGLDSRAVADAAKQTDASVAKALRSLPLSDAARTQIGEGADALASKHERVYLRVFQKVRNLEPRYPVAIGTGPCSVQQASRPLFSAGFKGVRGAQGILCCNA